MAKARDIDGLHAEMSFAEAAALSVAVRADEVWQRADDVLDTSDIEAVHDMRVATRRLRAVLETYAPCFDAKQHRKVLRDVKRLADALGERRDPDVQLENLAALSGELDPADAEGIELYAARQRALQQEGNEALEDALRAATESDLTGRLQLLATSARGGAA